MTHGPAAQNVHVQVIHHLQKHNHSSSLPDLTGPLRETCQVLFAHLHIVKRNLNAGLRE